jgi:hypothetical protein
MRKHDRSIRAALKHSNKHSRLNNAGVRHPKWKRPNALKHGAFSINPAIPGEDPREFEALHSALIDEWNPSDLTEEDRVFNLADAMWRKLRAQKILRAALIADTLNPRSDTFDEPRGLLHFSIYMRSEPDAAFAKHASRHLRADKIKHLEQKFSRSEYKSTKEWAEAVIEEISTELLPAALVLDKPTEETGTLSEVFRKSLVETRLTLSILHASEYFEYEVDLRERLDANIVRAVKHLVQVKAMKQMLRQTSTEREDDQPRKIPAVSDSKKILVTSIPKNIRV